MGRGQAAEQDRRHRIGGCRLELRDRCLGVADPEPDESENARGRPTGFAQLCCRRPRVRHVAAQGVDQPVPCDGSNALAPLTDLVGEARRLEEVERRVSPAPGLEVQPGRLEQRPRQRDDGVRTGCGGHLVEELAEERVVAEADADERLDGGEDQLRVVP